MGEIEYEGLNGAPVDDDLDAGHVWAEGISESEVDILADWLRLGYAFDAIAASMVSTITRSVLQTAVAHPEWAAGWAARLHEHTPSVSEFLIETVLRRLPIPLTEQPYAAAQVVESEGVRSHGRD